jgi:mycothiol synthase
MSTTTTPSALPQPSAPDLRPLIAAAQAADGQPPFSDQALVDLRAGTRTLIETDAAAAIVGDGEVEFVVAPESRGVGHGISLLERVLASTDGPLLAWAHGDLPAARALAASHGFVAVRELLKLAADVPAPGRQPFASFRIGVDEDAWVELNARIFAFHPEQGSVSRDDLLALEQEEWFDADDFLLAWDGDELVGYCWLKIHGGDGEFYVVGVAPTRQGSGSGRALMAAGFARLAARGIRAASLYVEGDNTPALALYRSLGFATASRDVQYRLAR